MNKLDNDEDKDDNVQWCPICDYPMDETWQNVGFDPPDPTKMEFTGYRCTNCGYEEKV